MSNSDGASTGWIPGSGFRLGTWLGVQVFVDWSLLIIFTLITLHLSLGLFPAWHPTWSLPFRVWMAIVAALLFFSSILLHELSHAWMAKAVGMRVQRITLFLFGGLAQIEGECPSPKAELWVAGVGPVVSLLIGGLSLLVGAAWVAPQAAAFALPQETLAWAAALGPVPTLLFWLGPINILLAVFNLIPGFPLDGGRLLRAAFWYWTGNLQRATRWASYGGQAFAAFLMVIGFAMLLGASWPWLGGGLLQGLWLLMIGWFLHHAAKGSYQELLLHDALQGVPVESLMRRDWVSLPPDMQVDEWIRTYLMQSEQRAFPVMQDGTWSGLVTLGDVRRVSRSEWGQTSIHDIMIPAADVVKLTPQADALEALKELGRLGVGQVAVVDAGNFLGFVRREDVMRWLSFHPELGKAPSPLPAHRTHVEQEVETTPAAKTEATTTATTEAEAETAPAPPQLRPT